MSIYTPKCAAFARHNKAFNGVPCGLNADWSYETWSYGYTQEGYQILTMDMEEGDDFRVFLWDIKKYENGADAEDCIVKEWRSDNPKRIVIIAARLQKEEKI